jgi:tRNA G10  N-methylase Trm11
MQSLIILGRQSHLGLAELESLYGAEFLRPVGATAVAIDLSPASINFARLGGMVKFAKILTVLDTTNWGEIQKFLEQTVPQHAANLSEGKLRLGLSVYGLKVDPARIQATGLQLKKVIRNSGRGVRYVPNVEPELNAAQVLHNQLTQKLGWELLFVRDKDKTIVAQSIAVQDIDAYRMRDQERPHRDARVGMLPPKLAQIIINLATGVNQNHLPQTVLDPFCGTGVILQEAQLMRYGVYGTDLEPRMVEYSEKNLQWLHARMKADSAFCCHCEVADATSYSWQHPFDAVAAETYLGRPLTTLPDSQTLQKIISDCNTIHKKFLQNLANQTKEGFRLCIAVPAWKTKEGFKHMPVLDSLESLGYNRIKFAHAPQKDLIYHRPDQTVARELVVLTRK